MATTPIYLDNAATTPVDSVVLQAMLPYFSERFYNPSAQYEAARRVKQALDNARSTVAGYLGCRSAELVFTAGGTEANNLAIHGVMQQYPEGNIVVSAVEHDSVLAPAGRYDVRIAPVRPDGLVDLPKLEQLIDDQTALVSIQYANNEIGTIQPLKEIAQIVAKKRAERTDLPLFFHTDACQAAAYLDLHVARLGVDLMTINASKIYGPKQVGALYVRGGIQLVPQLLGGGQERGNRSGTENVAGIIGFATALKLVQDRRQQEAKRLVELQKLFFAGISKLVPSVIINGSLKHRLANNVHLTFAGQDNERLMMQLDDAGIICAAGSACSASSSDEPSHVLHAIGLSDEQARASLRFSMGSRTTKSDIEHTTAALAKLIA